MTFSVVFICSNTHVVSRDTRFYFEYLEKRELGSNKFKVRRENELKILEDHYKLLIEGINHSLNLINTRFDENFMELKNNISHKYRLKAKFRMSNHNTNHRLPQ